MPNKVENTVTMESVRIIFRNFAGKEGQYNREGDRNFAVILDEDTANAMAEDGWNVKRLNPREEDLEDNPEGTPYLGVTVSYKGRPPRVVLIADGVRTNLDENTISIVDQVDIENVDLIVNPYNWVVNGKSGVKAYLQSMYITLRQDELDRKYADLPMQGQSPND